MKYIRTKNGIYTLLSTYELNNRTYYCTDEQISSFDVSEVIKEADTIEELCDKFVYNDDVFKNVIYENYKALKMLLKIRKNYIVYGAIWTDKGLIYVAKINDKGELELL